MMKIKNIFAILMVMAPYAAVAQNLNPTVEVSKSYEGKLVEVDKPQLKMAVPDSVYKFNLDFDYSVADTPYNGSYEFSPYSVDMAPAPTVRNVNSMYLKAGVGYQLHPVLDFVWSPSFKKPMRLNIYASHNSFLGKYWNMALHPSDGTFANVDRVGKDYKGDATWDGYDFRSKAGVEGRYDWNKLLVKFDLSAEAVQQKDFTGSERSLYGIDAKAVVSSKPSDDRFSYKVDTEYHFGEDFVSVPEAGRTALTDSEIELDATLSYELLSGHKVILDAGVNIAGTQGFLVSGATDIDVVPHYVFTHKRLNFDLGLRYSKAVRSVSSTDSYQHYVQLFYPDVRIEFMAIPDAMKLYVNLNGDSGVDSYADVRRFNGRADMFYGRGVWNVVGVNEEKVNASLGIEGRIGNRFGYDLKAGIVSVGSALLDGVVMSGDKLLPAVGYASYDRAYANLDWNWNIEPVRFGGSLEFNYCFNAANKYSQGLFFPPMVRGDVSVSYNWRKRIFASIDCEFATARGGSVMRDESDFVVSRIPGYADLGVNAEYAVNRKFSVWLRGGNLLGMTIQRSVLYAEKGPYFTAGVYLNL